MKKPITKAKPILTKVIFSACMLSVFASFAYAQSTTTERDDEMPAVASPSLPTITSGRVATQLRAAPESVTRPSAPRKLGEFEKYVSTVLGSKTLDTAGLTLFGTDLFSSVPSTFAPLAAAQVNQDYIIGAGDELQIRGWGMVNIEVIAKVDRDGSVYIPRVGSVNVAGIKYRDLQSYLKKAVSKNFNNFDLAVSISQVRPVQIYVVGHATRPGTYTLSAMSTLLNALFTSGGPDSTGSMRNIEVKRGGQVVTTFDMYEMLLKGDKSRDIPLQDGDVVYVNRVGPLVAISGNVKRPAIFELKKASTMADALEWAGGVASTADDKKIVIEKNVENDFKTVATLTAGDGAQQSILSAIPLNPADIIRVFSPSAVGIEASLSNEYVRVFGEVKHNGVFKLEKGETLRSFISRIGVTENAYIFATDVTRESVRRAQQIKLDEISQRFLRDLEVGASQQLGSTTDRDVVAMINSATERQRAIAQRMASVKAKGRIVLELKDGDAEVKNLPELALRDGDSVYVPRRPDTVEVLGSVFQQSSFIYRSSRRVDDYVELAGGASQTADKSQMYVIRADGTAESGHNSGWFSGVGATKINPGDTVVVPEEIVHSSWVQSLKEWTAIFYQFGLGAAGLKVLKD